MGVGGGEDVVELEMDCPQPLEVIDSQSICKGKLNSQLRL